MRGSSQFANEFLIWRCEAPPPVVADAGAGKSKPRRGRRLAERADRHDDPQPGVGSAAIS